MVKNSAIEPFILRSWLLTMYFSVSKIEFNVNKWWCGSDINYIQCELRCAAWSVRPRHCSRPCRYWNRLRIHLKADSSVQFQFIIFICFASFVGCQYHFHISFVSLSSAFQWLDQIAIDLHLWFIHFRKDLAMKTISKWFSSMVLLIISCIAVNIRVESAFFKWNSELNSNVCP